jgi:hypothetical protein
MRNFTMRKLCPACRATFTITSAASVYCQNRDCQNKRRRDDRAAKKSGTSAYSRPIPDGTDAHLERAIESGD